MKETILFDKAWYFHKGDVTTSISSEKMPAYRSAKTERAHVGPASKDYVFEFDWQADGEYKTDRWDKINLPHDYMLGYTPDRAYNEALGYCKYENAWYIKHFTLDRTDAGRRISFLFEGIATHSTIYVNGCLLKRNFCGYTSFEVDATDAVKFGEDNVISIYVSTEEHEGWWYEGGGIYRHVRMIKSEPVSIDLWGVFANPRKNADGTWTVKTEVTLRNDAYTRKSVRVEGVLMDGETVIATAAVTGRLPLRENRILTYEFEVASPHLWSPDDPYRYTVRTRAFCGNQQVDESDVRIGFRTYVTDPDHGLFINGKHYKIKGVCAHENTGLTGKYVPDNLQRYRIQLLKEMGVNAYRTAHYPHSEAMMEALDDAGFIVMDETRWFESTEDGLAQLTMLLKRDRNRPCVFFWSIGNEEELHKKDEGKRITRAMVAHLKKFDTSRTILTAVTHEPRNATVFDDTDVVAINYKWDHYDDLRKKYPSKPFLAAEYGAAASTRGWYFPTDPSRAVYSAYDRAMDPPQFLSRETTWKFIDERDWVMGGYQWNAFEYMGESTQWPRLCSVSGAVDLYLQKKDAFYQNMSHWSNTPTVHLLPHWNFKGLEGHPILVVAYTNAERVELFLNGISCGIREVERNGHAEWEIPYSEGTIEARAYNGDVLVATDARTTTDKAHRLMLTLETSEIAPDDVALLSCYVVDRYGREVPDASPLVRFTASGAGKLFTTGSSITDHTSPFSPDRKMWMGRVSVTVKLSDTHGTVNIFAQADGLESAALQFDI